ncbi:MAG: hypothetical protein H5T64_08855 [Chloroflexi bacterium]|nr:hypothetical protein [Chloroflexota bacterium]
MLRKAVIALGISAVITLFTGLFDVRHLLGATNRGLPFTWLTRVVYPGADWTVNWVNLVLNIVIWFVLAFVVGQVLTRGPST